MSISWTRSRTGPNPVPANALGGRAAINRAAGARASQELASDMSSSLAIALITSAHGVPSPAVGTGNASPASPGGGDSLPSARQPRPPRNRTGRLARKHFFLTFAGVENDHPLIANPELAVAQLMRVLKGDRKLFVLGIEEHSEPADPTRSKHFHAVISSNVTTDVAGQHVFDLRLHGARTLKAHHEAMGPTKRDLHKCIHYCMKDGNFLICAEWAQLPAPRDTTSMRWYEALHAAESMQEAEDILQADFPQHYYMYGQNILHMLARRHGTFVQPRFALSDFTMPPLSWADADCKAVVLYGKSSAGKTEFALAHFEKPLLVCTIDDLKDLTSVNDGIVFDDMRFDHLAPETVISLLDPHYTRSIHARYRNAIIPPGIPKIFTTNLGMTWPHEHIFPAGRNVDQQRAISRRFRAVHIDNNLFNLATADALVVLGP